MIWAPAHDWDLELHKARDCTVLPLAGTSPRRHTGGILTADGEAVTASLVYRGNSAAVRPPDRRPSVSSECREAVFGGYICDHFGHFIFETLNRLWALPHVPADLQCLNKPGLEGRGQELLGVFGIAGL